MKRKLLFIGLIFIVLGGACLLLFYSHTTAASYRTNPVNTTVSEASTTSATSTTSSATASSSPDSINFEIVTTPAAQQQGLGGRAVIPDNYAMLFVFPTDGSYGFWMKDMLTSIDMIWVSSDGTIVGIAPDVSPATYPSVFYPPLPIRYVLETRVGLAKEKGWHVGTKIQLPLPY